MAEDSRAVNLRIASAEELRYCGERLTRWLGVGRVRVETDSDAAAVEVPVAGVPADLMIREEALALAVGADFVKSSTGFLSGGAQPSDISLMRGVAGDKLGVKASGGIRTIKDAQIMIEAGASRIGTSAGVAIVESARQQSA